MNFITFRNGRERERERERERNFICVKRVRAETEGETYPVVRDDALTFYFNNFPMVSNVYLSRMRRKVKQPLYILLEKKKRERKKKRRKKRTAESSDNDG